jgi:hypothetical protein
VADAPESSELYRKLLIGDYGKYIADFTNGLKTIIIRDPKSYETKTGTASEKVEWKSKKLAHEFGHFIFNLFHPKDEGSKIGITAEQDKNLRLEKRDIEMQMNKKDALIIIR